MIAFAKLRKLLPRQKPGKPALMLSAEHVNDLVDFINALKRMEGRNGIKIYFAGQNVIIEGGGETTTPSATGMSVWFRGLWNGGPAAYQEAWKVASGSYAGTYVCVNPNGTSLNPWEGVDWVMISQSNAIGNWT